MPSVATSQAIDWEHAFTLFSQGLSYPEISVQTGATQVAIRSRASRHKWRDRVATARQQVQLVQQKRVDKLLKPLAERSEAWIDLTATNLEQTAQVITSKPIPKSFMGLMQYEQLMGLHVKRGRATFGLDQQQTAVQVNIGLFGQGDVVEKSVDQVVEIAPNPDQPT